MHFGILLKKKTQHHGGLKWQDALNLNMHKNKSYFAKKLTSQKKLPEVALPGNRHTEYKMIKN